MLGKLGLLSPVVLVIAYLYYQNFWYLPSPVVTLKDGKVQGIVSLSRDGKEFYEYLGIPFGKALRFESPQPAEPWEGIFHASQFGDICLQLDTFFFGFTIGSEDCLFLNVYVPKDAPNKPLPVMVYIHGGLYHVGSTQMAGPKNFMDHNIILVSIQYRLGALGFLSTGDEVVRGNMGLKDQNLALQWVQANIGFFGGNPNQVTIFGESAGGGSVHHNVIFSKSGLFSKAIHQSGSAINYWGLYRNVKEQAKRFAKKFECPTDDSKKMVECLKKLDGRALVGEHIDMMEPFRLRISSFAPTIEAIKDEDAFIIEEPLEALKNGRFNRVPLIAGCNSDEGLMISAPMMQNQSKLNEANDDFESWAPKALHYPARLKDAAKKIRKFYFGDLTTPINSTKFFQNYTNLFGDRLFIYSTAISGRLESKYVPTYLYIYDHKGGFSIATFFSYKEGNLHPILNVFWNMFKRFVQHWILGQTIPHYGTSHGDEIGSLFSVWSPLKIVFAPNPNDEAVSRDIVKLWVDFASDKKPLKYRDLSWPAVNPESIKYLRISDDPAVIDEPFDMRRKFWDSLNISDE